MLFDPSLLGPTKNTPRSAQRQKSGRQAVVGQLVGSASLPDGAEDLHLLKSSQMEKKNTCWSSSARCPLKPTGNIKHIHFSKCMKDDWLQNDLTQRESWILIDLRYPPPPTDWVSWPRSLRVCSSAGLLSFVSTPSFAGPPSPPCSPRPKKLLDLSICLVRAEPHQY